jgi:hypothetical protein
MYVWPPTLSSSVPKWIEYMYLFKKKKEAET